LYKRLFEALGILDIDYHEKYRKYINEKRYAKYLEALRVDMFTRLIDLKRELDIEKKLKEKFPEPEYTIRYTK
jgi:hypothetical protein